MSLISKRSLFYVLSRLPWWLSVLLAAALFMVVRQFLPNLAAFASTLPLLGIAAYAGWRQLRVPGDEGGADALAELRTLSWRDFSERIDAAFRCDGYTTVALAGQAANYELRKSGRVTLAGCKRWKVANTGVEPLRALRQAMQTAEAAACIYVTAGDLSPNARQYAAQNGIRLLCDAELVAFLARARGGNKAAVVQAPGVAKRSPAP